MMKYLSNILLLYIIILITPCFTGCTRNIGQEQKSLLKTNNEILVPLESEENIYVPEYDNDNEYENDFITSIVRDDFGEITAIAINGYKGNNQIIKIPPEIQGLPVRIINEGAFTNKGLLSVTIPESVISIRNYAFSGNNLADVIIPDGVYHIGDYAFYRNQIKSLTLGYNVVDIGDYAFSENKLTNVFIPDRVEQIGRSAFDGELLTSISVFSLLLLYNRGTSKNQ